MSLSLQVFLEGGGNQDALLQKEEAGVKSEDTIRMYNELVRSNDLVLLIVGVNSLFTEPMSHP